MGVEFMIISLKALITSSVTLNRHERENIQWRQFFAIWWEEVSEAPKTMEFNYKASGSPPDSD